MLVAALVSCDDLANEVSMVKPGTKCSCSDGSVASCGNTTTNCRSSSLAEACYMHTET